MRSILLLCFVCHFSFFVPAQVSISGKVASAEEALPYVNIGIRAKGIGTVSDDGGYFKLSHPNISLKDTLTFSCVGFELLNIPVSEILSGKLEVFELAPKVVELEAVSIKPKKVKQRHIGTRSHNPFLVTFAQKEDNDFDIHEYAKLIRINKPSFVKSTSLHLHIISGDTARIRINFYKVSNDLPGNRLVEKSIIARTAMKLGWVTIDLSEFNIEVSGDFFISYELLPDRDRIKGAVGFGSQFGGTFYSRNESLGAWDKFAGATLSSYVTVLQ